jgi:hypothetical protein
MRPVADWWPMGNTADQLHVAVIDIGSPRRKNLGWSIVGPDCSEGTDLNDCISKLAAALKKGPLALGFEAPMFVPMREEPTELTMAREGECVNGVNRAFSGGPGAAVTVTGLVVVPFVLSKLKTECPKAQATIKWHSRPFLPGQLFLFEAFVTNRGPGQPELNCHIEDAKLAAQKARGGLLETAKLDSDVTTEPASMSLLGAMMLRTGWTKDPSILAEQCLVVKA